MPASPDDIDVFEARKLQQYNRGYKICKVRLSEVNCRKLIIRISEKHSQKC